MHICAFSLGTALLGFPICDRYQACLMGSGDLVKLLLAHNADPNLAGRGSSVRPTAPEDTRSNPHR